MATLHVHIDESGNWSFTPKGSKFYVFAVAWTYDPQPLAQALTALRFQMVRDGVNIDCFHAAEDRQATRDAVVGTALAHGNWNFASVVLDKRKINPVLREPHRFYPKFAGALLKFVLRGHLRHGTDRVLVFADTIPMPSNAKREGVVKAIKTTCAATLPNGTTHHVFSHRSTSNKWLQVVDYCCWGVARKWELGDDRTYKQLQPRLAATELDVTARGDGTTYY
jgi:hypothetical protein